MNVDFSPPSSIKFGVLPHFEWKYNLYLFLLKLSVRLLKNIPMFLLEKRKKKWKKEMDNSELFCLTPGFYNLS